MCFGPVRSMLQILKLFCRSHSSWSVTVLPASCSKRRDWLFPHTSWSSCLPMERLSGLDAVARRLTHARDPARRCAAWLKPSSPGRKTNHLCSGWTPRKKTPRRTRRLIHICSNGAARSSRPPRTAHPLSFLILRNAQVPRCVAERWSKGFELSNCFRRALWARICLKMGHSRRQQMSRHGTDVHREGASISWDAIAGGLGLHGDGSSEAIMAFQRLNVSPGTAYLVAFDTRSALTSGTQRVYLLCFDAERDFVQALPQSVRLHGCAG